MKITLRQLGRFLLLVVLAFVVEQELEARHIVGGEVTYRCIGQPSATTREYEIRVYVYRDCASGGALFDSQIGSSSLFEMTVFEGSRVVRTPQITSRGLVIDAIPVDLTNPCIVFPPNICVERGVYTTTLVLPIVSETYTIAYQRCCRNETISNLVRPGDVGATYLVEIPPQAQQSCNNSPVYTDFPPLVICANFELEFDHGATDADGDSLVYSLCDPYLGGGNITNGAGVEGPFGVTPNPETPPPYQSVPFGPGYNLNQPILGSISIDSRTGLLRVTPTTVGQFVLCVSVQEFRNGQLISEVRRDFQFNIVECDPRVQAGISAIMGADSVAPNLVLVCGDRSVTLVDVSTDRNFISEVQWQIPGTAVGDVDTRSPSVALTFPDYGTYPGLLIANPGLPCTDSAEFNIVLSPPSEADFTFSYDTCLYAPVSFENLSSTEADSIVSIRWDFGDGGESTEEDPEYLYSRVGRRNVILTIRDNFGCTYQQLRPIDYFPLPAELDLNIDLASQCQPAFLDFSNTVGLITEEYDVFWDFGDGNTSTEFAPVHQYAEPGNYSIYFRAISPFNCEIDTQLRTPFQVFESPIAAFSFTPPEVDIRDPVVSFFDESQLAASWQWFFDSVGTSREQNPIYTFPDSGAYNVMLVISHLNGCFDTAFGQLIVRPFQSLFVPNAFTPNRDGLNELFRVAGFTRYISEFRMRIYNRWGELIFETDDIEGGWDGLNQRNGQKSQTGVYLFTVDYVGLEGAEKLSGYVTLLE